MDACTTGWQAERRLIAAWSVAGAAAVPWPRGICAELAVNLASRCAPAGPPAAGGQLAALQQSNETWNKLARAFQSDILQQPQMLTGLGLCRGAVDTSAW